MKTLAQLKTERQAYELKIGLLESQLTGLKKSSKAAEQEYLKLRREKGRTERDLRATKKKVDRLKKRIQTLPSQVRTWGKNNPGELIKTLEGDKVVRT